MNILLWLLAAAAAGWITWLTLGLHASGCVFVSAIIGFVGVIFGGDALAPAIGGGREATVLSPFAVLVASTSAIGCLKIAATVYRHFQAAAVDQRTVHKLL